MTLLEQSQVGLTRSDRCSSVLLDIELERPTRTLTRITVSTRSRNWYQVRMEPLHSPELAEHMRAIAASEWRRHNGFRTITVRATDEITGEVIDVTHGQLLPPCPKCGFDSSAPHDYVPPKETP